MTVNESGVLVVDLKPGGGLTCVDADGLSVTFPSFTADDSGTIDFSGDGSSGSHLTASVKKSTDNCNALINGSDGGLYVACQDGVANTSVVQVSPQGVGLPQTVDDGGTYDYLNDNAFNSIHICNPTCCAVNGIIIVSVGDIYFEGHPGFIGGGRLQANIDNAGFADLQPLPRQTFSCDSGNAQNQYMDIYQQASLFINCAPSGSAGDCHDYQFRLRFAINTSPNANKSVLRTDSTGPKFVTRWILTHTACCDHA